MKFLNPKFIIVLLLIAGLGFAESNARMPKDDKGVTRRNLRVLPRNISDDQLIEVMKGINKSLGVKCGYCHVQKQGELNADGKPVMDFASDDKHEKRIARKMMRMTKGLNERLEDIGDHKFERIGCVTCHRGSTSPASTLDSIFRAIPN